ncbi:hypothetical protein DEO72_LG9g296 [Vigna unguiculata]|uniref:Uncharacterized protein n=1 Tax=Vigna unguiculata TaxID=3917 RepID=A0A4D6MV62_VIGUN|nr:hypothetical protein DEO72_LG9g296 [Vigna unguiculata]
MDEHKTCFKKTVQKRFGLSKAVAERNTNVAKEVESSLPLQTALQEYFFKDHNVVHFPQTEQSDEDNKAFKQQPQR